MHDLHRAKRVVPRLTLCLLIFMLNGGCVNGAAKGEDVTGNAHNDESATLRDALERDVTALSTAIGARHVARPRALSAAADYVTARFEQAGYAVEQQTYEVRGVACRNIIAEVRGRRAPDQIVIIGAHYDSLPGSPGANDNASGIAALLALARAARVLEPERTLRFVAFVNEEPPFFQTDQMGSMVYAKRAHQRGENIVAMISFDGLGYYSDEPWSQQYPSPLLHLFYPSTGNFISVVGNRASKALADRMVKAFRAASDFPIAGAAVPNNIPQAGFSDHASFWRFGYPAVMVTDTLPFRYPHYHEPTDLPKHVDFDRMARVVEGLRSAMRELSKAPQRSDE